MDSKKWDLMESILVELQCISQQYAGSLEELEATKIKIRHVRRKIEDILKQLDMLSRTPASPPNKEGPWEKINMT